MPNNTTLAIVMIAAIVITCAIKDIDGWLVFSGCSLIAGLGGYAIGKFKRK